MHSLPKGSRSRADGWTELLQTNNYTSLSQSQEVTSTASLNNSFQGLITFPCRKFFLSSQLSPSCCPVSPNGWVPFPSPNLWSQGQRVRNRTGTTSNVCSVSLHPKDLRLLGSRQSSDRDHLLQPVTAKLLSAAQGVPRGLQSAHPHHWMLCSV